MPIIYSRRDSVSSLESSDQHSPVASCYPASVLEEESERDHAHSHNSQDGDDWYDEGGVLMQFTSPDYSRPSSRLSSSPPQTPGGARSDTRGTSYSPQPGPGAGYRESEQQELDGSPAQSHSSTEAVVQEPRLAPSDPHCVKGDVRTFSEPYTGSDLISLHIGEVDPFDAFEEEGRRLSADLFDIFRWTEGEGTEKCSRREFLTKLDFWKLEVANATIALLRHVTNDHGRGQDVNEYLWTSDFSIYFWWRTCKIAWDIECAATPEGDTKITKIPLKSAPILEVFNSLLGHFCKILQSDVTILSSGCQPTMRSDPEYGFLSLLELLDRGVFFESTPNLDTLPDIVYQQLGRPRPTNSSIKNGHNELKMVLPNCQVLLADFECLSSELEPAAHESNRCSALLMESDESSVSCLESDNIHVKSPFKQYLHRVVIKLSKTTGREVQHIFRNLTRGKESVFVLFNRLRLTLMDAPELFLQFKMFVPNEARGKWSFAENSILTENQYANFKREVRLKWISLIEKAQECPSCLESTCPVEFTVLKEVGRAWALLPTAVDSISYNSYKLTREATSKIATLIDKINNLSYSIAAGLEIFDTLTAESKMLWETTIRIEWEAITEELRRRSIAEVEKAGVGTGYFEDFLKKRSSRAKAMNL